LLLDKISNILLKRHHSTGVAMEETLKTVQDLWPYDPIRLQITFDEHNFESGSELLRNKMYSSAFVNCFIDNNSSANPKAIELLSEISQKIELFFEYMEHEQRLDKALSHKLSMLEEKQRREIASNLHDHLGQALAMMKIKLKTLRGNAIFCGLDNTFDELISLTDQSISYTRTLTAELVPPALYELGLIPSLEWLAESSSKKYKFKVNFTGLADMPKLPDDYNIVLFRSVHELIVNAAKHASASKVDISIEKISDSRFLINVIDDGVGFDPKKHLKNIKDDPTCFGLLSVRQRLAFNGGRLLIESTSGKGTHATIEVNI
jgi:signal transduction histidine kinase